MLMGIGYADFQTNWGVNALIAFFVHRSWCYDGFIEFIENGTDRIGGPLTDRPL